MNTNNYCGKLGFENESLAMHYLDRLKRTSANGQINSVRAYLCPNCLMWHLTSSPKSKDFKHHKIEIERLKNKCQNYKAEVKKLHLYINKLKQKNHE